ncbi:MAG: hypothetical protein Aurels2KO_36790 [Aureliella sp.]
MDQKSALKRPAVQRNSNNATEFWGEFPLEAEFEGSTICYKYSTDSIAAEPKTLKILALEWLSSQASENNDGASELHPSLLDEGLAMLAVLVEGFLAAGHEVHTLLSPAAARATGQQWNSRGVQVTKCDPCSKGDDPTATILDQWALLADSADAVWLVAPELDGILQMAIKRLESHPQLLCCRPPMLDVACDKLLTARAFEQQRVKQPTTWLLSECEPIKLDASPQTPLIAKRRDGAGCEGTRLIRSPEELGKLLSEPSDQTAWVVQTWIEGKSYSLSSFLGPYGTAWMQPVQQTVAIMQGSLAYHGSALVEQPPKLNEMVSTAEKAICSLGGGALGWVGVDLVFSDIEQSWFAIEVNPRLTSSSAILSASHSGNLIGELLDLCFLASRPKGIIGTRENMIARFG